MYCFICKVLTAAAPQSSSSHVRSETACTCARCDTASHDSLPPPTPGRLGPVQAGASTRLRHNAGRWSGTVAHAGQIQQIVVAPKWKQFRLALNSKDLVADRMKIMQTIIDADTNAAKLIKKCVIFAGNMIAVTVKEEDTSRLHVTNTVRDYASLRGTIRCTALNDILIGYECHLNDITTSEIVLGAMGFVTATPATFHGSLDKAFALMLRCSAGELWHQSGQNLMEGMEALVRVLSSTLGNLVGESTNGGPVRSCANGLQ